MAAHEGRQGGHMVGTWRAHGGHMHSSMHSQPTPSLESLGRQILDEALQEAIAGEEFFIRSATKINKSMQSKN
jgi:hypothetical protein